MPQVAV